MHRTFFLAFVWLSCLTCPNLSVAHSDSAAIVDDTPAFAAANNNHFYVAVDWLSGPPILGDVGAARLTFLNANKEAAKAVDIVARVTHGQMSHPVQTAHGEATPANVVDASGIALDEPGSWEMTIDGEVDGQQDSVRLSYEVFVPISSGNESILP